MPQTLVATPTARAIPNGAERLLKDTLLALAPASAWAEEPLPALFAKVERAKQEWEATADALPELICLISEDGHILRVNRTAETWGLGDVQAMPGKDLHGLLHPDCSALFCSLGLFLRQAGKAVAQGEPANFESYDPILGRHLLIQVWPVSPKETMAAPTTAVIVHDVTARKQAEEALCHRTDTLLVMNQIASAILAARSPDDIARAALDHIRPLVPFCHARLTLRRPESDDFSVLEAAANGAVHLRPERSVPGSAFGSSGERRPDRFFMVPDLADLPDCSMIEQQLLSEGVRSFVHVPLMADGESIGSLALGSTQPHAFGAEHVDILREVADLLAIATRQAQLNERLRRAHADLEAAVQAKDEMIQNVSHELRTPLALIYGYCGMLEEGTLGLLTAEQTGALRIQHEQADRLAFMIDRLLALQTFDAAKLNPVPFNPTAWLGQIVRAWRVRPSSTKARIQFLVQAAPGLPTLSGDLHSLAQVMDNLLDNAVKFSPKDSLVRVRAWEEGDTVVIAVEDRGIGLSPEQLQQIFQRFFQVDGGSRRHFGGLGIGLALCRAIVEGHGGHIWAESAGKNQGTTFYVALPIRNNVAAQAAA